MLLDKKILLSMQLSNTKRINENSEIFVLLVESYSYKFFILTIMN